MTERNNDVEKNVRFYHVQKNNKESGNFNEKKNNILSNDLYQEYKSNPKFKLSILESPRSK